jgi:hypothetical protein
MRYCCPCVQPSFCLYALEPVSLTLIYNSFYCLQLQQSKQLTLSNTQLTLSNTPSVTSNMNPEALNVPTLLHGSKQYG